MDLLWTLLLALPTIFMAAFLAAMLENVRERRRTRRWVYRNLRELVNEAQFPSITPALDSLQRWLAAESPEDLSDDDWRRSWFVSFSTAPDLSPLLRSEAATAVPADLFRALNRLDSEIAVLKRLEAYVDEYFTREIAPLWYGRKVPLSGADRRRMEQFCRLVGVLVDTVGNTRKAFESLRMITPI